MDMVSNPAVRLLALAVFPITVPIAVWTNAGGYADKFASMPGIQKGGGAISGLIALFYIAFLLSLVGGVGALTSTVDIDNTLNASGGSDEQQAETSTPQPEPITPNQSEAPTRTSTPTATRTPTQTPEDTPVKTETTSTDDQEDSTNETELRRFRYDQFMDAYENITHIDGFTGTRYTVNASNESATFYWVTNPKNMTRWMSENKNAMVHYAGLSESLRESDRHPVSQIPKHLKFVVLTPEGEVYQTSYVEYMSAWRFTKDVMGGFSYHAIFYEHAKPGPAHPNYEANQTATATGG
ncbi:MULTISPECIES: hypothetical protein [Halomicrobium]|uniref:Uncharacterized protein n=2 Tax=Halomicrobium mukohataei TaxID=57705 RepID=C7P372_HALMD|nr:MULTISPECIES: hypothetical protein [Halomicrobium]ACV47544.1 hypothetical protein Hmuk_1423 [Halomicrobium mukohataei DSM 12286]QCD66007.1 hypothetical protein E5139_10270 [Halomicrobium mukohataei]QFR20812.1 hypothetical protein GBQ70_10265 [Halomicrobium sp. ZPS1]